VDEEGWEDDPVPEPGEGVRHFAFGVGRVVRIEGRGRDMRVTVAFPRIGRKTFAARLARLERVKEAV
jgi:hypothetical protein